MSLKITRALLAGGVAFGLASGAATAYASSHMDAPLITLDDSANTTDVYAFRSQSEDGATQYLTTALSVYPFEEPGIGPNNFRFDDRVRYEIHVALGDKIAAGQRDITYRFEFKTQYEQEDTIRQAFLGLVEPADKPGKFPANQNMRQSYRVTKFDHRNGSETILGDGFKDGLIVPPNNQGLLTPFYNQNDDGDNPAKGGVASESDLDVYTSDALAPLPFGYRAFAGQRDDGFYADIQSIFDLDFSFGQATGTATKPFDSQGGYNVHTLVLDIPLSELAGEQIAGVYATTSRLVPSLAKNGKGPKKKQPFAQVGRQGNPLFAEALVALIDKDFYNESTPEVDSETFAIYAQDIELSNLLGVSEIIPGLVESIFIPDMIKVDLTTGPARLAGQSGFHRLGVFGLDVLQSTFQDPFGTGGLVPGGWPNGRRFGDDVVDVAVIAVGAAGPGGVPEILAGNFANVDVDGVTGNDITYNDVFPYAATPLNGRNHDHHAVPSEAF